MSNKPKKIHSKNTKFIEAMNATIIANQAAKHANEKLAALNLEMNGLSPGERLIHPLDEERCSMIKEARNAHSYD